MLTNKGQSLFTPLLNYTLLLETKKSYAEIRKEKTGIPEIFKLRFFIDQNLF